MITCLLTGCVGVPKGVKPVQGFELDRYLGRWYEIARLDHSFERGLSHVTADYSMRKDGGVRVLNRGYSEKKQEWKTAEGKAYFVKGPDRRLLEGLVLRAILRLVCDLRTGSEELPIRDHLRAQQIVPLDFGSNA